MPRDKAMGRHVAPPKGRIGSIYSGEKYMAEVRVEPMTYCMQTACLNHLLYTMSLTH